MKLFITLRLFCFYQKVLKYTSFDLHLQSIAQIIMFALFFFFNQVLGILLLLNRLTDPLKSSNVSLVLLQWTAGFGQLFRGENLES